MKEWNNNKKKIIEYFYTQISCLRVQNKDKNDTARVLTLPVEYAI